MRLRQNWHAAIYAIRCWRRWPTFLPTIVLRSNEFDSFAEYVATAEEHGMENYPLYEWTKATIENPAKKEKYLKSFTLYVDGREVYAKEIADALAADLQPLARSGLITRLSKYDTDPANNPQPPKHPRDSE